MFTCKPAYRLFLLLLLTSFIVVPLQVVAQVQVFGQAEEQQNSIKKTICSYWREWYNFRHSYVYPANELVCLYGLIADQPLNPVAGLRKIAGYDKVPDYFNTGCPLLTARFGVGIADALLAEKPIENIVKDDVIHFISYYGCRIALDKAIPHLLPSLEKDISNASIENFFFRLIVHYLKHEIASIGSKYIDRPIGHVACYAIRSYKDRLVSQKRVPSGPIIVQQGQARYKATV